MEIFMLSFRGFLFEEVKSSIKRLASKGSRAEYDAQKYVRPHIGSETPTHNLSTDTKHFKAGDEVTVHAHSVDENGNHFVHVSQPNSDHIEKVPQSSLLKNKVQRNRGLENENTLVAHLNKHGLMKRAGAGFTAGNDFELEDNRTKKTIKGSSGEHHETGGNPRGGLQGEHKSNIKSTAFGQITVVPHPETGKWHIPDHARQKRPEYAKAVESAKVTGPDGKTRSLLDHMNEYDKPGTKNAGGGYSDHTDLSPAHSYFRDHHVNVAHIDSHGTFRAGLSHEKDTHKTGLPQMEGQGRFRYRQKQPTNTNSRSIQFGITKLNKSDVNIGTDEGATEMKKRLGHL